MFLLTRLALWFTVLHSPLPTHPSIQTHTCTWRANVLVTSHLEMGSSLKPLIPAIHPTMILRQMMAAQPTSKDRSLNRTLPSSSKLPLASSTLFPSLVTDTQFLSKNLSVSFVKGQLVNTFIFEGHVFSVATTPLCHCRIEAIGLYGKR